MVLCFKSALPQCVTDSKHGMIHSMQEMVHTLMSVYIGKTEHQGRKTDKNVKLGRRNFINF